MKDGERADEPANPINDSLAGRQILGLDLEGLRV